MATAMDKFYSMVGQFNDQKDRQGALENQELNRQILQQQLEFQTATTELRMKNLEQDLKNNEALYNQRASAELRAQAQHDALMANTTNDETRAAAAESRATKLFPDQQNYLRQQISSSAAAQAQSEQLTLESKNQIDSNNFLLAADHLDRATSKIASLGRDEKGTIMAIADEITFLKSFNNPKYEPVIQQLQNAMNAPTGTVIDRLNSAPKNFADTGLMAFNQNLNMMSPEQKRATQAYIAQSIVSSFDRFTPGGAAQDLPYQMFDEGTLNQMGLPSRASTSGEKTARDLATEAFDAIAQPEFIPGGTGKPDPKVDPINSDRIPRFRPHVSDVKSYNKSLRENNLSAIDLSVPKTRVLLEKVAAGETLTSSEERLVFPYAVPRSFNEEQQRLWDAVPIGRDINSKNPVTISGGKNQLRLYNLFIKNLPFQKNPEKFINSFLSLHGTKLTPAMLEHTNKFAYSLGYDPSLYADKLASTLQRVVAQGGE